MAGNRLQYIDAMRGFTMILVVYGHVIGIMLQNTPPHLLSSVKEIFVLFHMPLFFFISGYFVYSATYDSTLFKKRGADRLVKQFYPTVILWLICCSLFQDGDVYQWFADSFKGGYWFTFVSVEMFFTVAPLLWLLSRHRASPKQSSIYLLLLCLIIEIFYLRYRGLFLSNHSFNVMSLWLYCRNIPYFFMGIIAKIHRELFQRLCCNVGFVLGAITVFILSVIYPQYSFLGFTSAISGTIIVYSIFYFFERNPHPVTTKTFKLLAIIGTATLEIYLLHYFFIFIFRNHVNLDYLASLTGSIYEFPVFLAVSLAICVMCLSVVRLMKKVRLYRWIFP